MTQGVPDKKRSDWWCVSWSEAWDDERKFEVEAAASAQFERRYGYPPPFVDVEKRLLWLGPIRDNADGRDEGNGNSVSEHGLR